MSTRFNYAKVYPQVLEKMLEMEKFAKSTGIEPKLYELIKIRASQINGCAYCINMHSADSRALGEEERRIYLLNAWRETTYYTEKEKAALELTEYVTQISKAGVPDEVYDRVRAQFDEKETIGLVIVINTINSWNRIAISTKMMPPA
ncbi:carboxymuconolactone decarboxylase family protein [Leptospira langatensis]|uniref:Carboxymuconolactone decarboxylase family protein n=1 Tax=Leptospira langatensis TaxID=2484983 RepID=A0A5F1ZTS7_9LEPT|nr:carboxymuconolactone decarboxylase family protein [Leptospira langatensis]TGK02551.1 carboxymuconolactone decarboxylase family protein [Leptospira langatensis]TGL40248.1 carboxymuconolactone decarboxylase family protein [Leptospira langatensis]